MTSKQRILKYIEYKKYSIREFARKCDFSHTIFQNEKSALGADNLEKIITNYPEINLLWIVTGKGEMLIGNDKKEVNFNELELLKENRKLRLRIEELEKELQQSKSNDKITT